MDMLRKLPGLKALGAALALFLFFLFLLPFSLPILMAALFAFALAPMAEKFFRRWKGKRWQLTSVVLFVVVFVIFAPVILLVVRAAAILTDESTLADLREIFNKNLGAAKEAASALLERVNTLGMIPGEGSVEKQVRMIESYSSKGASKVFEYLGAWVTELPELGFSFLIFIACLFVFISRARAIKAAFIKLGFFEPLEIDETIGALQQSCRTALLSTVIIGFIQATVVSLGAGIIGYGDPWIIFPLAFLTSFIPVIGVAPIALTLAAGSGLSGANGQAIAFLLLALFVGTIDNILRVYLVGSEEKDLNPVLGLLVILGAIVFIGLPGLFIGPVVASLGAKAFANLQRR